MTALRTLTLLFLMSAPAWSSEQTKVYASDGTLDDRFGPVAIDGNRIVVGAPYDHTWAPYAGSAYVFVFDGTQWQEQQKIISPNGVYGEQFGSKVALSGDTLVVASGGGQTGAAAYVFQNAGGSWSFQKKLVDNCDCEEGTCSIAIENDLIVVGAPWDGPAGSAYVFRKVGASWTLERRFVGETWGYARLGSSVDIDGRRIVVGAHLAAMVLKHDGGWNLEGILYPYDDQDQNLFGQSVTMRGDVVVVGAPNGSPQSNWAGEIYPWRFNGSQWIPDAKVLSPTGTRFDSFGRELSYSEDGLYVSGDFLQSTSAVYTFADNGGTWTQVAKITPCDGALGTYFGSSLSAISGVVAIGAPLDDTRGTDFGSVYIEGDPEVEPPKEAYVPQPAIFNGPVDGLGLMASCQCEDADAPVIQQSRDVAWSLNRTGGATVLPHSGQEVLDATDLSFKGRDSVTDLNLRRRHITRVNNQDSIFGPAWEMNYRQYFRPGPGGHDVELYGFGRRDLFQRAQTPNYVWEGTTGRMGRFVWDGASTSTLRLPGGAKLIFHTETIGGGIYGILSEIVSPNENRIRFVYESADDQPALFKRRLLTIYESFGRPIEFFYEDPDYPQGVSRIRDFSDREFLYDYNDRGQLLSFRTPTVKSTYALNDFPDGKVTAYRYLNHSDPRLEHAIESVTFPNQVQAPGQPSRLSWVYDTSFPSNPTFGFVMFHTIGNTALEPELAAGGTFAYSYQIRATGTGPNDLAVRTTITDRRGTKTVIDCNALGQMLQEDVLTRGFRGGEPQRRSRTFVYNEDGDLIRSTTPMGGMATRAHEDPSYSPRFSHANEIEIDNAPDSRGADHRIQRQVVYEPVFNKPFKIIDPRGFEGSRHPDDYTTTYIYDYMEDLAGAAQKFAPELGITESELHALFSRAGISSHGDINGDGMVTQYCGNVLKVEHPDVRLPSQADRFGLGPIQESFDLYRYNCAGQLIWHRDAEENVTIRSYFPANDPDGNGVIDVPGGETEPVGYLRQIVRDNEESPGRNSGDNPQPVRQTTSYEYKSQLQGLLPENLRGIPTATIDPRGVKHVSLVNELDQVIVRIKALDVSASPEALWPLMFLSFNFYDANDNLVQTWAQKKHGHDGIGYIKHAFEYDILDQLRREIRDLGGIHIVDESYYDSSQNLVQRVRGAGSPDQAADVWLYDERDILVSHTRGYLGDHGEESTSRTEIDDNGNIVTRIDAEGGDRTHFEFDGFDRLRKTVDPLGHETCLFYDAASNRIATEAWGPTAPGYPEHVLLARTETDYDERNRSYRTDRHLFHYRDRRIGLPDDGDLDSGDGLVSEITIRDRLGRAVGRVDADDDSTLAQFDGLGRLIRTFDPAGNETERTYDAAGNLLVLREFERSELFQGAENFVTRSVYDALGRRLLVLEPNNQTTRFQYDSRDNLVTTIDPLGNRVEHFFDHLGRATGTDTFLSPDGRDGRPGNLDPKQGGGDGIISIRQDWDALHRLIRRIDDNGFATEYVYDDLDRKRTCFLADNTVETWDYNADSELLTHVNPNGSIETWTFDAKSRPIRVEVDNSGALANGFPVGGTTAKKLSYDGMNRLVRATDNNDPNDSSDDVTYEFWVDSLSRQIREIQVIGTMSPLSVDTHWQGARRVRFQDYPNGRQLERVYDGLDRLFEIREANDDSLIARFAYVGPFRDAEIRYGNFAVLSKLNAEGSRTDSGVGAGYDRNRRSVCHEWKTSTGSQITSYLNTYNDSGSGDGRGTNRRASETREHLGQRDEYAFDSAYRTVQFLRNIDPSSGKGGRLSTRTLDGADKMVALNDESRNRRPIVGGANQYVSFAGQDRTYDDSHNLISGWREMVYDFQGRLVRITLPNGSSYRLVYGPGNRRVLKLSESDGRTTRYAYNGWQVVEERDGLDTVLRQYVDGRSLDEHIQLKDYTRAGAPVYYYHGNDQGFVGALTDANQDLVETYEYTWLGQAIRRDESGTIRPPNSAVGNPYMFQGRRYDDEFGLYYFRNRYYDPWTGEFLTFDPMGMWHHGQGNGYGAFDEDGWNRSDPHGLLTINADAKIIDALGAFGFFEILPSVEVHLKLSANVKCNSTGRLEEGTPPSRSWAVVNDWDSVTVGRNTITIAPNAEGGTVTWRAGAHEGDAPIWEASAWFFGIVGAVVAQAPGGAAGTFDGAKKGAILEWMVDTEGSWDFEITWTVRCVPCSWEYPEAAGGGSGFGYYPRVEGVDEIEHTWWNSDFNSSREIEYTYFH